MPLIQTKVFENEFSDHERFRQMLAGACAVTLVVIMAVAIALVTTPAGNAAGRAARVARPYTGHAATLKPIVRLTNHATGARIAPPRRGR